MVTALNNTYYDLEDTQNPVKYYLDVNQMFAADGFQKSNIYYIRENNYKVYNNYLNPTIYTEGSFYDLDYKIFDFRHYNRFKTSFYVASFFMSDRLKEYESFTYTILDLFSDLGGAFEIFEVFGKLVIGYYVNKLFYYYIVNCLNQQIKIIDPKSKNVSCKEILKTQYTNTVSLDIKFNLVR